MFLSGLCCTLVVNSYEERFQKKKKKMHTLIIKLLLIIDELHATNWQTKLSFESSKSEYYFISSDKGY